jgi:hypothetical protein
MLTWENTPIQGTNAILEKLVVSHISILELVPLFSTEIKSLQCNRASSRQRLAAAESIPAASSGSLS